MKTRFGLALALAFPFLLASCGGARPATEAPATASTSKRSGDVAATAYHDLLQRIYVAYFGRPADPGGLAYWADAFRTHKLPLTLNEINASYATSATVRQFVDAFSSSAESAERYSGDHSAFVDAIYRNLYNREPDAVGKAFWVGALDKGIMSRASAALWIMGGAQAGDITIVNNKATVARAFTDALDTTTEHLAYGGPTAVALVRAMLASVGTLTDAANFPVQDTIDGLTRNCGVAGCPPDKYLTFVYDFSDGSAYAGLVPSAGGQTFASLPAAPVFAVSDYLVGVDSFSGFHMHSVVQWKNDRLYRQNLFGHGAAPAASIVSSLRLDDVCDVLNTSMSDVYIKRLSRAYDLVTPTHSYVSYRGKGADGSCSSADDVYFAVRMDMPETTAPLVVREPVHTFHANGVLTGFLVRNGQSIERVDANFDNPVTLFALAGADLTTLGHVGEQSNTWLFTSGANMYAFSAGAPDLVLSLAPGESAGTALSIDTQDIFISINSGQSAVRVVRYDLSGKTASTVGSISLAGTGATMHLTKTRVLLVSAGAVFALPRSGGAAQEILAGSSSAFVTPVTVVGERIWLHHRSPAKVVSAMSDGNGTLTFPLAGQAGCVMNSSLLIINAVNICDSILMVEDGRLKSYNGATGVLELDYGSLSATHAGKSSSYRLTPYASNGQGAVLNVSDIEGFETSSQTNYFFKVGQAGLTQLTVQ